MSLIEKFNIKFDFKNFIIISSFIISFYFWDFGAKYNLGIDTRYLTLIPLLFFINNKIFTNKDIRLIYIIIGILIFQYFYNYVIYKNDFLINDSKYFIALILTILLVIFCKKVLINNLKIICSFVIFIAPIFLITSSIEIWDEIDRLWQCSFFRPESKIFKLFFLENSHFAMIAIPALLLNVYYLSKKFNYLYFFATIIFFFSLIVFQSTTMIIGIILNIIILLFFNFKKLNKTFILSLIGILIISFSIFFNIYGCTRKFSDLFFHSYIMSKQKIDVYETKIKQDDNKNQKKELSLYENIEILYARTYIIFYKNTFDKTRKSNERKINLSSINADVDSFNELDDDHKEKVYHKINVSSQVAKNSFEIAIKTFLERPFGVGLNRFEIAFREQMNEQSSNFSDEVMKINLNDGGSNLNKLIAEFGIFSLLLFGYLLIFIFSKKISIENKIFLLPIIITQLLRGAGYFNGGFLISIILIILLVNEKKEKE